MIKEGVQELFMIYGGGSFVVEVTGYEDSVDNLNFFPDIMYVCYDGKEWELEWNDFKGAYEGVIFGAEGMIE